MGGPFHNLCPPQTTKFSSNHQILIQPTKFSKPLKIHIPTPPTLPFSWLPDQPLFLNTSLTRPIYPQLPAARYKSKSSPRPYPACSGVHILPHFRPCLVNHLKTKICTLAFQSF